MPTSSRREVRRLKGRTETQARVYTVIKGELDLLKDKFKALEKRLNRTLLERDLLRRAIRDLEKKSGIAADRTELTADEVAASDRSVEERAAAEAAEIARRTRPPEHAEHAPETRSGTAGGRARLRGRRLARGRRRGRPGRPARGEGGLTGTHPLPGRPPRVSLATRIFLGHAVVLVTFGLLILFSVSELHRNQQEIRLVSQGYLPLTQDAAALESFQRNQAQEAAQISAETDPQTRAALARLAPLTYPAAPPRPARARSRRRSPRSVPPPPPPSGPSSTRCSPGSSTSPVTSRWWSAPRPAPGPTRRRRTR